MATSDTSSRHSVHEKAILKASQNDIDDAIESILTAMDQNKSMPKDDVERALGSMCVMVEILSD